MNKTFQTLIQFSGGNLFAVILSSVSVFIFARWVEPSMLGEFRQYGILTSYLGFSKLLIDAAYRRNFVIAIGDNSFKEAKDILQDVRSYYYVVGTLGIAVFLILAFKSLLEHDWMSVQGWLLQIIIFSTTTVNNYSLPQFRGNKDFNKLNKVNIISALLGFIFLPLIYFLGFSGLILRSGMISVVKSFTTLRFLPFKDNAFSLRIPRIFEMTKISLPLDFANSIESFIVKPSINLYILERLGPSDFGIFMMALSLQGFLRSLPTSVNQVLNAKVSLKHRTFDSLERSFRFIIKPTILSSLAVLILLVCALVLLSFLIENYLISYSNALSVLYIRGFEVVFIMLSAPFVLINNNFMYKQRTFMVAFKVLATISILFWFESSLISVSFAFLFGYFMHTLVGYIVILVKIRSERLK